jgi:hypothetical protein
LFVEFHSFGSGITDARSYLYKWNGGNAESCKSLKGETRLLGKSLNGSGGVPDLVNNATNSVGVGSNRYVDGADARRA